MVWWHLVELLSLLKLSYPNECEEGGRRKRRRWTYSRWSWIIQQDLWTAPTLAGLERALRLWWTPWMTCGKALIPWGKSEIEVILSERGMNVGTSSVDHRFWFQLFHLSSVLLWTSSLMSLGLCTFTHKMQIIIPTSPSVHEDWMRQCVETQEILFSVRSFEFERSPNSVAS